VAALAVHELTVSHFRSYRLARLAFGGGPVAVHGANGAGKTNLLEALSLLSPGRGMRRARADDLMRQPQGLGWKVSALLESLEQHHEVETGAGQGGARATRIDGKAAPQLALGRIVRMLWLVPAMDRLWLEGAEGRRRFLDRMTLSFEPAHGDAMLAYEKAMRERNRLLRDQVSDAAWYRALESTMARTGATIMANRRLTLLRVSRALEGATTAFPGAELSLSAPEGQDIAEDEDTLARALAAGRRRDMAAGRSLSGPHRIDLQAVYAAKGVAARQCSTGEQKALLISLILANARALAEDFGAPPILLLDEVAAHLDADRRASLYDEICALGAQAFLTGTGRELFDELGERAQFFEVGEAAGTSDIRQG